MEEPVKKKKYRTSKGIKTAEMTQEFLSTRVNNGHYRNYIHNVRDPIVVPEFKEEFCEKLIMHMADGFSYESFAGTIGSTFDDLYKWERENPGFVTAKRIGKAACLLWWERLGKAGAAGLLEKFNSHAWAFNMMNRFREGWTPKKSIEEIRNPVMLEVQQMSDEELKEFVRTESRKLLE